MEIPIQYALSAPEHLPNEFRSFDPVEASPLEFERLRQRAQPRFGGGQVPVGVGVRAQEDPGFVVRQAAQMNVENVCSSI